MSTMGRLNSRGVRIKCSVALARSGEMSRGRRPSPTAKKGI